MFANQIHEALATPYVQKMIQFKARQLTRHSGFHESELHDLEQEMAIYVLEQAHLFDPQRGGVNTFVARVVRSVITKSLRNRKRSKRAAGFRARSLQDKLPREEDGLGTLGELLDEADGGRRLGIDVLSAQQQLDHVLDVRQVISQLPPPLQEIATRLASANELTIARDLGISRRQVRNAVAAIRERFERAGFFVNFSEFSKNLKPSGQLAEERAK